jgi:alpha-tubulin suppressor-like RCC1 family protein
MTGRLLAATGLVLALGGCSEAMVEQPPAPRTCPLATPELGGGRGRAVQVALGHQHGCARFESGEVWCWGLIVYPGAKLLPTPVPGPSCIVELGGGAAHHCARDYWGDIWCWGSDAEGESGHYDDPSLVPRTVPGVSGAVDVAAGGKSASAALLDSGEVMVWGQRPTVLGGYALEPEIYADALDVAALPDGSWARCFIHHDRTVSCVGGNASGEAGIGMPGVWPEVPTEVVGLTGATRIVTSGASTCALDETAEAICWGYGLAVGDGNPENAFAPRGAVALGGPVTDVATAFDHACAALADGTAWCWGDNYAGELGVTPVGDQWLTPIQVPGLGGVVDVAVSSSRSCAVTDAGSVWCWGANDCGELGTGYRIPAATVPYPVRVPLPEG